MPGPTGQIAGNSCPVFSIIVLHISNMAKERRVHAKTEYKRLELRDITLNVSVIKDTALPDIA